jgi:hypothetical protein
MYSAQQINRTYVETLLSGKIEKVAAAETKYTRLRMADMVITRKIYSPETISQSDLDREVDSQVPSVVVDLEPDAPAAISAPLMSTPVRWFLKGKRYRVYVTHVHSSEMQYDVNQILTWEAPVQKIISDRFVEELGTKEDAAFFAMVKTALGGAANTVVPFTGVVQWKEFSGGVTRKNVQRAKVITQGTPYFIEPSKAVVNVITMAEIYGWHRDEAGGNYSMDLMKGDHEALDIAGLKWIVTRKWQSHFVPNNTIYFFATPEYTGKFFMTQDAKTVVTNDHEPLVLFRAYETIGFVLGNVASVARADFVP